MAAPLTHRGIEAEVRHFPADGIWAGRLLVGAVVNFRADKRGGVVPAFRAAVDEYLEGLQTEQERQHRIRQGIEQAPAEEKQPAPEPVADHPSELRYDTWRGGQR